MARGRLRTWGGRLVVAAMIVAGACSQHRPDDPFANYDPSDPFNDEFFDSSFGDSDSLDEVMNGPSPSVGWLYDGEAGPNAALDDHADSFWDDDPGSNDFAKGPGEEKSFSEKATEASLSTLSILVGAGMTALPFLMGT